MKLKKITSNTEIYLVVEVGTINPIYLNGIKDIQSAMYVFENCSISDKRSFKEKVELTPLKLLDFTKLSTLQNLIRMVKKSLISSHRETFIAYIDLHVDNFVYTITWNKWDKFSPIDFVFMYQNN